MGWRWTTYAGTACGGAFAVIALASQVSVAQAQSNLAGWAHLLGIRHLPQALSSTHADNWITSITLVMSGVSIACAFLPEIQKAIFRAGYASSAREHAAEKQRERSARKVPEAKRVYVSDSVTVEFLTGLAGNLSNLQIDRAQTPYHGKWIRVSGRLYNVDTISKELLHISMAVSDQTADINTHFCYAVISADMIAQLEAIRPGDPVAVVGRIKKIADRSISLDLAELA